MILWTVAALAGLAILAWFAIRRRPPSSEDSVPSPPAPPAAMDARSSAIAEIIPVSEEEPSTPAASPEQPTDAVEPAVTPFDDAPSSAPAPAADPTTANISPPPSPSSAGENPPSEILIVAAEPRIHPVPEVCARPEVAAAPGPSDTTDVSNVQVPEAEEAPAAPSRYRAPIPTAPRAEPRARQRREENPTGGNSTLDIRVHATIDRAGRFEFSLLFARPPGAPPVLQFKSHNRSIDLVSRDDDWYDAQSLDGLDELLRNGLAVSARTNGATIRWQLSLGRTFFVFAHETALGWVHQSRVKLGLKQFVIARREDGNRVRGILGESCPPIVHDPASPLPGWIIVGPFVPASVPRAIDDDHSGNLLRPLPDVSISLDGGLWLRGSEWLEGFGPCIRLAGRLPEGESVHIDGVPASIGADGSLTTAASHEIGAHTVQCLGASARYSIVPPPDQWDPMPDAGEGMELSNPGTNSVLVSVPSTNPVLLGARPGEFLVCPPRGGGTWTGYVHFDPVWALPADPAHCDRRTARILAHNSRPVWQERRRVGRTRRQSTDETRWYMAILASRRKGLAVSPQDLAGLWDSYVAEAHRLRRERR
jgi:hypothetical protein